MVITKFEDDDDWGDSTNVDYFNDGKTVNNLIKLIIFIIKVFFKVIIIFKNIILSYVIIS